MTAKKYPKVRDPFEQAKPYVPGCYYKEECMLRSLTFSKKDSAGGMSASDVSFFLLLL